MNWWEVSEAYKFTKNNISNNYTLRIELIADGQPYDFKIADDSWSNQNNCGTEFGKQSLKLEKAKRLYCSGDSANIQFTPAETGVYEFILLSSSSRSPNLKVSRIN